MTHITKKYELRALCERKEVWYLESVEIECMGDWHVFSMIILLISHDKIVRPSGEVDPYRRVRCG